MDSETLKSRGRVYTPPRIVDEMLDLAYYMDDSALDMNVMENSCGNGAFIIRMAERFCKAYEQKYGRFDGLAKAFSSHVHGMDIDPVAVQECKAALDDFIGKQDDEHVDWDIRCADTLEEGLSSSCRGMDLVIGNPPYVAYRNMTERQKAMIRNYAYGKVGTPDLYVVFFEIGLKMLRPGGRLVYITPSTYFHTGAGAPLRDRIAGRRECDILMDIKGYEADFDAQTSAVITCMNKHQERDYIMILEWSKEGVIDLGVINYPELFIEGIISICQAGERRERLRHILAAKNGLDSKIQVSSGIMTGCDEAYFGKFEDFMDFMGPYVIKAYKPRKGEYNYCICPYDSDGTLVPLDKLPKGIADRFKKYENRLKSRKTVSSGNDDWYAWPNINGNQALIRKERVAVTNLVTDLSSVIVEDVLPGCVVYGSPSVLVNKHHSAESIIAVLKSQDFVDYIHDMHKIKGTGKTADGRGLKYEYTVNDLECYLRYMLEIKPNEHIEGLRESTD